MNSIAAFETGQMVKEKTAQVAEKLFESYREADQLFEWIQTFSLVRAIVQFFHKIYLYLIVLPLFHIYIHGPSIGPIGFWSGKSFEQICSKLTNVDDPSFWSLTEENSKRCHILILQQFNSFWILFMGFLYFVFIYYLFRYITTCIYVSVRKIYSNSLTKKSS